ncbi:DUF302 domain-containing protein [Ancylobacter oerskovii]|nr:DUF302 domain-containing protein [Ancylobacter oerskovii]MBS7542474.1 DUF302 domain-containing protein [Ancylobacter oerskovii]
MAADGLISVKSQYQPQETLARLEATISERGLTVFARVDHAAGAAQVGLSLRPTVLVIFGNPKAGTPLMQSVQTAGIDLPLRVLVWQDADGSTWLSYYDVAWIAGHHGAGAEAKAAVARMSTALQAIASQAAEGWPPTK